MAGQDQQEHDPLVGTIFADRYLITGRLGKGGMAVVYKATDRNLNRDVAIKVLRKDVAGDPVAAKRLIREARAAASLHHPHIITILDVGERNGTVYVVMEILSGRSLADVLEQDGAIGVERSLAIGEQLASALVVAHAQGIVHRDIKPENLHLIEHGGTGDFVKVLDFSIAKLPTEMVTAALTRAGSVFGTPHYMAPEQVEGKGAGPQTDLYALGAVLFEMITGEPPFDGPSVIDILLKHVKVPPPVLKVPGGRMPAGLPELVAKLLAKKAEDRPASASATRDELARIIADLPRDSDAATDNHPAAQQGLPPALPAAVPTFQPPTFTPPAPRPMHAQAESPTVALDMARMPAALMGRPLGRGLPELPDAAPADLPDRPPADLPDGPPAESEATRTAEGKRKFAAFGEAAGAEQRTLVGPGVGHMVRELAKQRSEEAAPALQPPPPPPGRPAPVAADGAPHAPGAVLAPTAMAGAPVAAGATAAFAQPAGAGRPNSGAVSGQPSSPQRGAGAAEAARPTVPDSSRSATEPLAALAAGTGRPQAGKAPPPPPGALAGHTRRPPPRPPVDDRQATQPSLPHDPVASQRHQRHQQDTIMPTAQPVAAPAATPQGSRRGMWIAAGIAAGVVLGIVIWFAVNS